MLVDNNTFTWNLTNTLNPQSTQPVGQTTTPGGPANAGRLFAMVYAEDQGFSDVYFLGKIWAQSQNGQ
jgi:hypothetical protein